MDKSQYVNDRPTSSVDMSDSIQVKMASNS